MSTPCPICEAFICDDPTDFLYSLESDIFPFVLNCPPGYDCHGHQYFKILCCGQLLTATWQDGADISTIDAAINATLSQCAVLQSFCGGTAPTLFYNATEVCTTNCPDGSPYTFTVSAGSFAAAAQADANAQALAYACQQARLRLMCLSDIVGCACSGSSYSVTLSVTGGIGPFTFALAGGSLPTGLSISSGGVISGTPTASGISSFSVRVTAADGSFTVKPYSITVLKITTVSLPTFTIGTPYSYQLQATGGSGRYAWQITSGSLPNGLSLSLTGLISGTPL